MKPEKHRINLNMELETIQVIDEFAKMNNRSRSYVIESFLKPALPALRELLAMPEKLTSLSDVDRLAALAKLTQTEEKLTNLSRSMPAHLKGATE
jgi:uncharacterized protein (DUF1778 family)